MAIVDALSRALSSQNSGLIQNSLFPGRLSISSGRVAAPAASSSKTFSLVTSKDALAKAVAGAQTVIDTLSAISDQISRTDGMTRGSTISSDGRIGIQTEINRLTSRVNDAVADAGNDEINLLGTPSTTYQIRSSNMGGTLTIVSQPMDSTSLGLDAIDVTSQDGTEAAKTAINSAIRTATERLRTLSEAYADLPAPAQVSGALVTSLKSLVSGGLLTGATASVPKAGLNQDNSIGRGALVNFQA